MAKAWGTSWRARVCEGLSRVPAGWSKAGMWVWRMSRAWAKAVESETAKGWAGRLDMGGTPDSIPKHNINYGGERVKCKLNFLACGGMA